MISYEDKENELRVIFQHGGKTFSVNFMKNLIPADKIALMVECIGSIKKRLGKTPQVIDTSNKNKYLDCVYLTNDQYMNLCKRFNENKIERAIEILNNYKMSSGKQYKSDHHAILNWVMKRVEQEGNNLTHNKKYQMGREDFERELLKK